jgi:hypothetical protein
VNALKDLRTTIPGILIIVGATVALVSKSCTFDQWWQVILAVLALLGGSGLLMTNSKKGDSNG